MSDDDTDGSVRRIARRVALLLANGALGVFVFLLLAWELSGERPGWAAPFGAFLLLLAPLSLGLVRTDATPRPVYGLVALVAFPVVAGVVPVTDPVAQVAARYTGMDPVSALLAVDGGVDNAVTLGWLQVTLSAWLLVPGARGLLADPPSLLRDAAGSVPVSARSVVGAVAVVAVAGTLSAAFLAGYYPVTTVTTPGGTYEHAGVAVTVTDIERVDCDARACLTYPRVGSAEESGLSGEVLLVHVRATDRGHDDDRLIEAVRLVAPAAGDPRVRSRIDTVVVPAGNPLFEGSEEVADEVRVDDRRYPAYDPGRGTGRTNDGWLAFQRPPESDRNGTYLRIQTERPGPASKWPLTNGS